MNDKKNKKIKIIVLIGITCIIWGFVIMFISSVKKDQAEMNSRMDKIVKSYDDFSKKIEEFNNMRDSLHTEFLDKVYYEKLESQDTDFKNKLKTYEELVSNISLSTKNNLRKYCKDNIYYSSPDVNSKCAAFKQGYEEMVNSFVDDINSYNTNIEQYNNWLDNEKNTTSLKLEKYQTKKQYIDYNKDGTYSGKSDEASIDANSKESDK
ncbi:MAG: hypothetical protein Q4E39_05990 [bacterium]|nr:hypothetical protein [bacterium]